MGAIDTNYTFTATDVITSTKMNNILDQSTITATAVFNNTLDVASGKLLVKAGGITSNELAVSAVTTTAITDLNVTAGKIADLAVTTGKLNDLSVTTAKLAAGAVTPVKMSAFGTGVIPVQITQAVKTTTQTITSTTTSWSDVTDLSLTLTRLDVASTGKVRVQAVISGSTNSSNHGLAFRIMRDSTVIGVGTAAGNRLLAGSVGGYSGQHSQAPTIIDFIDDHDLTAAAITYKIQVKVYSAITGYINRAFTDDDAGDYSFRTISTMTLTELA